MQTGTIEVSTPDGAMPLYEVVPDGATRAMIVIQEGFGVNEYIQDVTQRVANEGYHAVAPHMFHRSGGGTVGYAEERTRDFILGAFGQLDDQKLLDDVDAAIAHLRKAGWKDEQIGIVGFCFGGRVVYLTALRRELGGAAAFYGGGVANQQLPQFPALIDETPAMQTPLLFQSGSLDGQIPPADSQRIKEALQAAPVDGDAILYEGADHGFYCDRRSEYNAEVSAIAWPRALEFLASHVQATS
jgi:carboxymethylenebutenolidase